MLHATLAMHVAMRDFLCAGLAHRHDLDVEMQLQSSERMIEIDVDHARSDFDDGYRALAAFLHRQVRDHAGLQSVRIAKVFLWYTLHLILATITVRFGGINRDFDAITRGVVDQR